MPRDNDKDNRRRPGGPSRFSGKPSGKSSGGASRGKPGGDRGRSGGDEKREYRPRTGARSEGRPASSEGKREYRPRDGDSRSERPRSRDADSRSERPRSRDDRAPRGKTFGDKKPYRPREEGGRTSFAKRDGDARSSRPSRPPRRDFEGRDGGEQKPWQKPRDSERPARSFDDRKRAPRDGDRPARSFDDRKRAPRGGDRPARSFDDRKRAPRDGDRPARSFDDRKRAPRGGDRPARSFDDRKRAPRDGDRPARSFDDRKRAPRDGDRPARSFDDRKRAPRDGDRPARSFDDRKRTPRDGDRPARNFDDRKRAPRDGDRPARSFDDRKRAPRDGDRPARSFDDRKRAPRDGDRPARSFDDRKRTSRDGERSYRPRGNDDAPRSPRSRQDRDGPARDDRPRGRDWQEHPRSERSGDRDRPSFSRPRRDDDRPRRENEDDTKIFAKRPAFGGRGAYRERDDRDDRRDKRPPAPKREKTGERIAKILARAGMCSRRDAEEWIVQGRVAVNGRVINSPALDVTATDKVTIDGKPLPERERTRLFLYHKPRGLMTTHADPEGRPTVFDNLPPDLPRLISIGRLDFNTEGLLLLTNDGGLARSLELPDTGWLRRYRVRAHGDVTQEQLDALKNGIEVDGVKYGSIDAQLERDSSANVWIVFAIREGKNREVRNVMAHLGLEVNRLIRISYGPFQLGEVAEGQAEEVRSKVLRDQLGDKIVTMSGAVFDTPAREADEKASKPRKTGVIADRKGRKVLVSRTGSDESRTRNENEANGYGPPRRPKRGYHGKRDLKPQD